MQTQQITTNDLDFELRCFGFNRSPQSPELIGCMEAYINFAF